MLMYANVLSMRKFGRAKEKEEATVLDKINEKLRPPLPPLMARFG